MSRAQAIVKTIACLDATETVSVINALIADLDSTQLEKIGVSMIARIEAISKVEPIAASMLARALLSTLKHYRPDAVAPLDAGFGPTEAVPEKALG